MASTSGGGAGGSGGTGPPHRSCESCNSAPAIPFCRVEWSYLCTGCGPVVHGNSWIVAMPPFPPANSNPNPNQPITGPYHYPYTMPNAVAGQDGGGAAVKRKRRRKSKEEVAEPGPGERGESVMRYKEKRKTRQFNKTTRSETRKAYAELRPRAEGQSTMADSTGEETKVDEMENVSVEMENIVVELDQTPPVVEEAIEEGQQ